MDMLRQRFANMDELVGHSLYVTVTVLTESGTQGGRMGTAGTCRATSCVCLSRSSVMRMGLGTYEDMWGRRRMGPVGTGGWGQKGEGCVGTGARGVGDSEDEDTWGWGQRGWGQCGWEQPGPSEVGQGCPLGDGEPWPDPR